MNKEIEAIEAKIKEVRGGIQQAHQEILHLECKKKTLELTEEYPKGCKIRTYDNHIFIVDRAGPGYIYGHRVDRPSTDGKPHQIWASDIAGKFK